MLRLVVVLLAIIPATVYHGLRMLWAVYRKSPDMPCICDESPKRWSRLLLSCSGADVVLENEQVIDPERPQILVANHVSWYDILALAAFVPGRSIFVAKAELRKVPLFGRSLEGCGHIFIDRRDLTRAVESLASASRRLKEESPTIIMFPEGTRSATGELQPFKKGAFVLAIETGADVVPAAISGSREILKKGSLLIRPGTIRVRFGEPISVRGLDLEQRNELTERAREALLALQASDAR